MGHEISESRERGGASDSKNPDPYYWVGVSQNAEDKKI